MSEPSPTPVARIGPLPAEVVAEALAATLEDLSPAVTVSEVPLDSGHWHVEAILTDPADLPDLTARTALLSTVLGQPIPDPALDWLAARDWVAHVYAELGPIPAGRFWVHGGHVTQPPPTNRKPLRIDAAMAFGTGEHATTRGCLLLFDRLVRAGTLSRRHVTRVLDMGCGTAVLGIAAAKTLRRPVLAVDIDRDSVTAAREFIALNRVETLVNAIHGDGFHLPTLARPQGFGLIFANILARPLIAMAPALARQLAPGGWVLLAGLLRRQKRATLKAYAREGLRWRAGLEVDGWSILALSRPPSRRPQRP